MAGSPKQPPKANELLRSVRAAMQNGLVVAVAVHEVEIFVGAWREADISHQRAGGELALNVHSDALAVLFEIEDRAGADIGHDFLGGNLHLCRRRIAAIALAGYILRVVADERKIVC